MPWPQHHHTTLLHQSAVERHFYVRQHQECVGKVRAQGVQGGPAWASVCFLFV
jgi:hypothetical protein